MNKSIPPQFFIAAMFCFVQNFSSTLLTNSLWPYLKLLDPEITESYFGYIISAASVTGLLSNIFCGLLTVKSKDVRLPITFGITCMILGNLVYLLLHDFNGNYRKGVLLSRLLCGLSAGNSCLISTFIAVNAVKNQLSRAIAITSCGSTLGMLLGPAFQNLFIVINYPVFDIFTIQINQYNAPALAAILLNLIALPVVSFLSFEERIIKYKLISQETDCLIPSQYDEENVEDDEDEEDFFHSYGYRGVFICLATRFVQMFVLSMMDTIGASYGMLMFHWNNAEALLYGSRSSLVIGILALVFHITYSTVLQIRWTNHIAGCIYALISFCCYFLISYPWSFIHNSQSISSIPSTCTNSTYVWCKHVYFVSTIRFYLPYYILITIAMCVLSLSNSTCLTLFAGKKYQGIVQSLQQISSYTSTIIGSIIIGKLFTQYGPQSVWLVEIVMTGSMALVWMLVAVARRVNENAVPHKKVSTINLLT